MPLESQSPEGGPKKEQPSSAPVIDRSTRRMEGLLQPANAEVLIAVESGPHISLDISRNTAQFIQERSILTDKSAPLLAARVKQWTEAGKQGDLFGEEDMDLFFWAMSHTRDRSPIGADDRTSVAQEVEEFPAKILRRLGLQLANEDGTDYRDFYYYCLVRLLQTRHEFSYRFGRRMKPSPADKQLIERQCVRFMANVLEEFRDIGKVRQFFQDLLIDVQVDCAHLREYVPDIAGAMKYRYPAQATVELYGRTPKPSALADDASTKKVLEQGERRQEIETAGTALANAMYAGPAQRHVWHDPLLHMFGNSPVTKRRIVCLCSGIEPSFTAQRTLARPHLFQLDAVSELAKKGYGTLMLHNAIEHFSSLCKHLSLPMNKERECYEALRVYLQTENGNWSTFIKFLMERMPKDRNREADHVARGILTFWQELRKQANTIGLSIVLPEKRREADMHEGAFLHMGEQASERFLILDSGALRSEWAKHKDLLAETAIVHHALTISTVSAEVDPGPKTMMAYAAHKAAISHNPGPHQTAGVWLRSNKQLIDAWCGHPVTARKMRYWLQSFATDEHGELDEGVLFTSVFGADESPLPPVTPYHPDVAPIGPTPIFVG